MKLLSVGIRNFRSIGEWPVHVRLDKKINILMGPNNAGKSNVIRALLWLRQKISVGGLHLGSLDQHKQAASNGFAVELVALVENEDPLKPLAGKEITVVVELTDDQLVCTQHPLE
ncbi:MAG: AAA family ATPase, partial [Planctomycetes bacterium]|nr:AAA family ATPase [Planctomycetota bacterium]